MAVKLRLPDPLGLPPVVLFHRTRPDEPLVILQVPNPGATDAETYRIKLDVPADRCWMERLPNGKNLLYMLTMESHLIYEPGSGSVRAVADLDAPAPFVEDIRRAERQHSKQPNSARPQQKRQQSNIMSKLRYAILGRSM